MQATGPAQARTLTGQIRWARLWLPVLIVLIVVAVETLLFPTTAPASRTGLRIGFYAVLGPLATALTLTWIAREVAAREVAQADQINTHAALQRSHERLKAIHEATERLAAANEPQAVADIAAQAVATVTGASAAAVHLGDESISFVGLEGMSDGAYQQVRSDAEAPRVDALTLVPPSRQPDGRYVLAQQVGNNKMLPAALYAVFDREPDTVTREAFAILSGELASVVDAAQGRMRDFLTLFEVDQTMRAEGNLQRLLDRLLAQTLERVSGTRGAVFLTSGDSLMRPQAVEPDMDAAAIQTRDSELVRVAREGAPVLLESIPDGMRAEAGGFLQGCSCAVVLPLQYEGELEGLMLIAQDRPGVLKRSQLSLLSLLASQVAVALRNAHAYLQSEELAIGEERSRIAREIHDGVAQSLAFASLKLDLAERLRTQDAERSDGELQEARAAIRESIREIRRSIFALRPVDLEQHGYLETVRRYSVDFAQQNNLYVDVHAPQAMPPFDVRSEAVLFRIFQEALHNVAKHARAKRLIVHTGINDAGAAFVTVEDDGDGFDVSLVGERVTTAGGLGLKQMRERVEQRNGRFEITSKPGAGTRVTASIPL